MPELSGFGDVTLRPGTECYVTGVGCFLFYAGAAFSKIGLRGDGMKIKSGWRYRSSHLNGMRSGLLRWRAARSANSLVLAIALLTSATWLLSPSAWATAAVSRAVSREGRGESFQIKEITEGLSWAIETWARVEVEAWMLDQTQPVLQDQLQIMAYGWVQTALPRTRWQSPGQTPITIKTPVRLRLRPQRRAQTLVSTGTETHTPKQPPAQTPTPAQTPLALQNQADCVFQATTPAQKPAPSLLPAQAQSKTKTKTKTKTPGRTQDAWISGVWMHPGLFGPRQDEAVSKMRTVLDDYARAGINTLIMLVKDTSGYVYFDSEIGVKDPAYDWDFFGAFLSEARQRNMTVHPWFCVFPEGALLGQVRQQPEWLIVGPNREMVRTVNPALPEVRAYEISLMTELVKKYGVDWVHLDYIRFPCEPTEPYFSHDPKTLKLFKDETGIDFTSLKARDSGNPHWNAWLEWNRQQVTRFVKELKDELQTTGRQVRISAAVFPDADNARVLIGQDWASWAEQGLIDMLCPMLYTNDPALFDRLTKRAVAIGLRSGGDQAQGEVGRGKLAGGREGTGSEVASRESLSRKEIRAGQEQAEKRRGDAIARISGENARPEINMKTDIASDIFYDITGDIMSDSHSSGGFNANSCPSPNSYNFAQKVSGQNQQDKQDKIEGAAPLLPAAVGADPVARQESELELPVEAEAGAKGRTEASSVAVRGKIPEAGAEAKLLRRLLVCPGIGIGTSHNQSTPDLMLEEIRLARAAGADGVIFFSGSSLTTPFLDRMRMGLSQHLSFLINALPDYAGYRIHY